MLREDEIVVQAEAEAKRIIAEATLTAQKVKNATNHYIDEILSRTEEVLTANLEDYRRKRQVIEKVKNKPKKQEPEEETEE